MSISTTDLVEGLRERRAKRAAASPATERAAETLEELRRLVLDVERERLTRVEQLLSPAELGKVLPEATLAAHAQSDAHAKALGPTVVGAIREAVEEEPKLFVDAITPAMGPAIRQAVTRAFRALVQQLNETLARALSIQGLRWRLEALRTGRPFAEVVVLHCLVYRVEQVFLVHRDSGLVVQHLSAKGSPQEDPDQVAAMLTAIDAFAHDAFREGARLERFDVGELICWIEHGSRTSLVAVVRGTAPERYADTLREAQERIEHQFGPALATFAGDAEPFVGVLPIMESCLRSEVTSGVSRPRLPYLALLCGGLCLLGAALLGLHWRAQLLRERRFQAALAALQSQPGVVITGAHDVDGRFTFEGLRDPLAPSPEAILTHAGLPADGARFRLAGFYSVDPRLTERRAAQILQPPAGVAMTSADRESGTLRITGTAPRAWIERAQILVQVLPGVERVEWRVAEETDPKSKLDELATHLRSLTILFASGSADIEAQGGSLNEVASAIKEMSRLAQRVGVRLDIHVMGHADPRGTELQNQELRKLRAERVTAELAARGVPANVLRPQAGPLRRSLDPSEPTRCGTAGQLRGAQCARRVDFHIDLQPVSNASEQTP